MTNIMTDLCGYVAGARQRYLPVALTLVAAMLACAAQPAAAQYKQQGPKLVGSDTTQGIDGSEIGQAVALSSDGNTALVGGYTDNNDEGAVWAFTRSGGVWTQQGMKLVPSNQATGPSHFGSSIAMSPDGTTAIIGGFSDNAGVGAAWIFTQSGGVWSEQAKLVPTDPTGASGFGVAVGLSSDGTIALIGGDSDNSNAGAAWIFTQTAGMWSEQQKFIPNNEVGTALFGASVALSPDGARALVGGPYNPPGGAVWAFTNNGGVWSQQATLAVTGAAGDPYLGYAVAISGDGNTAILGGYGDASDAGAAWIFTRNGNNWSQQGGKLTGSDAIGTSEQGLSVALSNDGNTALVGGDGDNTAVGAAWVYMRSGGTWTQRGTKLTASDAVQGCCGSRQGKSVALSADGTTALVGGLNDNSNVGAAWPFVPAPVSHDFNRDGISDVLWQDTSGDLAIWLMSAGQFSSGAGLGTVTSWSIAGTRDFNGDGYADILWLDNAGDLAIWLMNGASVSSFNGFGNVGTDWTIAGTGDFNGDGTGDILWRNGTTGDVAIWLLSNGAFSSGTDLGVMPSNLIVAGTGDFNGDGTTDILWRNTTTGKLSIWFMNNGQMSSSVNVGTVSTDWTVVGTGDFDGDGVSDILWRDSEGDAAIWLMNNSGQMASGTAFSGIPTTWSVAETGDFDGDGMSDILWIDQSGDLGVWLMNGLTINSGIGLGNVGTTWLVQGRNAD